MPRNSRRLRPASPRLGPTEQATTSQIMAHAGRFRTLNSLLSTTPPLAVRLNLHSDVLEESAIRSTTDGTLSLAIAGLESRIAPHREKLAAGRMLPAGPPVAAPVPAAAAAPPTVAPPTAANAIAAFAALI